MRQRGEADFAPPSVGRATRRETRLTSRESPPSERRLQLICDAARRASGSLRDRRPLLQQRGPATPPPATTVVRHRARAREPYRGAPARSRRRCAARRPPWPRPAARRARTRRPPSAPRGGTHRCAAKPPRLREPNEHRYRGAGPGPDPQPESRCAVRFAGQKCAGNAGEGLAQRGVGRPGRLSSPWRRRRAPQRLAAAPKQPENRCGRASRRQRRSAKC